jgi:hypothetical protein
MFVKYQLHIIFSKIQNYINSNPFAANTSRWERFGYHYSSFTGYNFLSLSLVLGYVKCQVVSLAFILVIS